MKIDTDLYSLEANNRGHLHQSKLGPSVASTKYHRAALDGYIDMLCDASKRDTNLASEEDGLTPTLMAAQSGQLDALRILVGRGGDPERTNSGGSSALHLAAARGHLNCVSFLVNFGVNMWSLDNDLHTAKDAAAIEQRKEVLDFLDQMMAKQSALNTKNVQKLKEKAKLAAEKRIKQVRKAQLKAIKQVERDERYLVKLSHNRRLLKAAHSISDIKLVGRHQPLDTTGVGANLNYLKPLSQLATGNGSGSSSSRLSSGSIISGSSSRSPSLANLMSHKLQMDLLGRPTATAAAAVGARPQVAAGPSRPLLSRRSVASSTTDESSAYSTSSVSSYLSAGSGAAAKRSARPKYSDLVAVNEAEKAKLQAKAASTEHASVKSSSSSSGNKFWGIGGVSRKVQLRRLLRAGATQSSSDLSSTSNRANKSDKVEPLGALTGSAAAIKDVLERSSAGKLCNVQPTIKLKLNNKLETASNAASNKWPLMTRAVSEPNFGVALRSAEEEEEDDDGRAQDDCDIIDLSASTETKLSANHHHQTKAKTKTKTTTREANDKVAPHHHHHQCHQSVAPAQQQPLQTVGHQEPNQQQLLNQCLSQLKLRHEALTMQNSHHENELREPAPATTNEQLLRPSRVSGACQLKGWPEIDSRLSAFGHSDELLQHQLSAGQFPLRPSLIKQQKQLQSRAEPVGSNKESEASTRSTAISVDSIGSAGSFAKRNSRPSSVSATSSSSSYLSSSSIDTAAPRTTPRTDGTESCPREVAEEVSLDKDQDEEEQARAEVDEAEPQLPPPLPPPLPPKTLTRPAGIQRSDALRLRRARAQQGGYEQEAGEPKPATIETFLEANGLADLTGVFAMEEIDLEALLLLSEEDLKSLNVLLGPRRKLLKAIDRERRRLETREVGQAGRPMYVVVDTQL